jgi:NADP-dependent 3-hydroxy acid dehydrogenase YdfG
LEKLQTLKSEIQQEHAIAIICEELDVTDHVAVRSFFEKLKKEKAQIDCCINNA